MIQSAVKYAFLGAPHLGGVYTVYRSLRSALAPYGIEVRWVGAGEHAKAITEDASWAHEHETGEAVWTSKSEAATGLALCQHIDTRGYDGVFVNVRMRSVEMNVARYLPRHIRRIMIVHSTQPGTYGPATSLRRYVHATIGVSPRIRADLVRWRRFDPDRTYAVCTGIDIERFRNRVRGQADALRLLYLGRIEDRQKGVFWLPDIMRRIEDTDATLTIAGLGPDLDALRDRCRNLRDRIRLVGFVPHEQVPVLMSQHDVLLMPSRYEGLGLSLIEAMAAGCVPIVSSLAGVTDAVVTHGDDGFLIPVGKVQEAAAYIRELAEAPSQRHAMATRATETAGRKFNLESMGSAYARIIDYVAQLGLERQPVTPTRWRYPLAFNNPLRRILPESIRRWAIAR